LALMLAPPQVEVRPANPSNDLDRPQHTRFFVHIVQHMHCLNSTTLAKFGDQISVDKVGKSLRLRGTSCTLPYNSDVEA
jgi:hypothetical protein